MSFHKGYSCIWLYLRCGCIMPRMKIKIAFVTWGGGGGIAGTARMDAYYRKYIDRDQFTPKIIFSSEPFESDKALPDYGDRIYYTGIEHRLNALVELLSDVDIVHFQGGFDPLACEAARLAEVPVLVETLHTAELGQMYPNIDLTICVSESVRAIQPFPEKAITIHNGLEISEFPFRKGSRSSETVSILVLKPNQMEIPYLDVLKDLLDMDPRIEIRIAGNMQDEYSAISSRMKFLGKVHDMAKLYGETDLMALLSPIEAFGMVIIEAMSCGCIPIVSNVWGPPEIVTDGHDGFLASPFDARHLRATVVRALELHDSGQFDAIRANGRRTVEERFTIEECVKRYERAYLGQFKKKGVRTKAFVPTAGGYKSVDADIADAFFHFRNNRTSHTMGRLEKIVGNSLENLHPCMLSALFQLSIFAEAEGREPLAHTLFDSAFHRLIADSLKIGEVLKWTRSVSAANLIKKRFSDYIMENTEKFLLIGENGNALATLATGINAMPDSVELAEVYNLLKTKLPSP